MAKFNLKESTATLSEGAKELSELLSREQLKEIGPEVAQDILMNICVVVANSFEEQTGAFPADERELVQAMQSACKSLYRMKSSMMIISRKVLANPKAYTQKVKRGF